MILHFLDSVLLWDLRALVVLMFYLINRKFHYRTKVMLKDTMVKKRCMWLNAVFFRSKTTVKKLTYAHLSSSDSFSIFAIMKYVEYYMSTLL